MKDRTRREFMVNGAKLTGAAIGAATIGHGFLLVQSSEAAAEVFPESDCGVINKNGAKVLIAYASQCGSTGEVAEAIGEVLCQGGATVETKWVKNVRALDGYDAVVIGSAIQKSQWMPEAKDFLVTHQNALSRMPVAYFLTCLTLYKQTEETHRKAKAFLNPLRKAAPQVNPVSIGRFAGVLDYSKLSFMYRTVMKRKMKKRGIPEGDFRDWDAIRAWAKEAQHAITELEQPDRI